MSQESENSNIISIDRFVHRQNSVPEDEFLGLSPNQMHNILFQPFELNNEIFYFKLNDADRLRKVPLMEQSIFFMDKLKESGGLKGTKKGNLPRAFIVELFYKFFLNEYYPGYFPYREGDLFQAILLKHILGISNLIKKRNNKYSLTKKGEELINLENSDKLFTELFLCFFNRLNWSFSDGYSELDLIQMSAVFNIYLLHKKAQEWILDDDLGTFYLHVFPYLVDFVKSYFSPEEEIIRCFSIRFLERVCLPLGLLESKHEGKAFEKKTFYRVSPFFKDTLVFYPK